MGYNKTERKSAQEIIAAKIVEAIENGVAPWHKPWVCSPGSRPQNAVTKKPYRGANIWVLGASDYKDPRWLTFNQALELARKNKDNYETALADDYSNCDDFEDNATSQKAEKRLKPGVGVRKGEKGTPVVFWKWFESKDGKSRIPWLRYYTVFNVQQCEGLGLPVHVPPPPRNGDNPLDAADSIVKNYATCPEIKHKGEKAYYSPKLDYIQLPKFEDFDSAVDYYNTKFHEIIHSTGHESRLNRPGVAKFDLFGSEKYATEELVAEMGAAFLCGESGIEAGHDQSAAYIGSWAKKIKDDPKIFITAAGQAQKAVDYIIGDTTEVEEEEETTEEELVAA